MARNIKQAITMVQITALSEALLIVLGSLLGLVALALKSDLAANLALPYLIKTILPAGMKGIVIIGLLATLMSTTDSALNSGGIALVHDVIQPLRSKPLPDSKALALTRVATFSLGIATIVFPLYWKNIMDIWLFAFNFWSPVVLIPLIVGILGYRSSIRSFLIAGGTGVAMAYLYKPLLGSVLPIPAVLPALIANALAFYIARTFDQPHEIFVPQWEKSTPWYKEWQKRLAEQKQKEKAERQQTVTPPVGLPIATATPRQVLKRETIQLYKKLLWPVRTLARTPSKMSQWVLQPRAKLGCTIRTIWPVCAGKRPASLWSVVSD